MEVKDAVKKKDIAREELRPTAYRRVILLFLVLFLMVAYADRANIGVVLPYIKREFALTNLQAGALASFFFLGSLPMFIPTGLVMAKIGSRIMTSLCLLGFSIFTFLIGTSSGAAAMKWHRLGLGVTEAPAGIAGGALVKAWYPPKEQGTAWGIYYTASQVAVIVVPPVAAAIAVHWGWRMVFFSFSVPGIFIAILWFIFVRNEPESCPFCNGKEREYILQSNPEQRSQTDRQGESMGWLDTFIRVRRGTKALDTVGQVFRSWNIWADCIAFCFLAIVQFGLMVWVPSYLVTERHLSMIRMGFMAALPFLGGAVGFFAGGWASDKFWRSRRKPMMFIGSISSAIVLYLLAHAPADPVVLGVLLFLTGLTPALGATGYLSYPMGLTNRKTYPTALAIGTTLATFGGFFTSIFAGYLLDVFKTFTAVFYFYGVAVIMTFVFALTMIEPLQTVGIERDS